MRSKNDLPGDLRVYLADNPFMHERNWPVHSLDEAGFWLLAWQSIEKHVRATPDPWRTGIEIFNGVHWEPFTATEEQQALYIARGEMTPPTEPGE